MLGPIGAVPDDCLRCTRRHTLSTAALQIYSLKVSVQLPLTCSRTFDKRSHSMFQQTVDQLHASDAEA